MMLQPVSDLILDVANAADPQKAALTKQKLAEAAGGDFPHLFQTTAKSVGSSSWSDQARAGFFAGQTGKPLLAGDPAEQAKRGLETLIAKMLVENLLPKENAATFGHGTAGGVWRSMLADRLAEDLTRGQGLGMFKNVSFQKGTA